MWPPTSDAACTLRVATLDDATVLEALIVASVTALSRDDYDDAQIAAALRGAFGLDTQLIRDGTYFVVEAEHRIVACGGYSKRKTLFGGDRHGARDAE